MICAVFAACMTHISRNMSSQKAGVLRVYAPLTLLMMPPGIACLMSLAVCFRSRSGNVLLTLFPVVVNVGIGRGAAATICAQRQMALTGGVMCWRHWLRNVADYFAFVNLIRHSNLLSSGNDIWIKAHLSWNVRCVTTTLPFYAVFAVHAVGTLVFDGKWVAIFIITILVISQLNCLRCRFIRSCLEWLIAGWQTAFANVVIFLLVAANYIQLRGKLSTIGLFKVTDFIACD